MDMDLEKLHRILEHSAVNKLHDHNGWGVAAIGFATMDEAREAHRFLREIYLFWRDFPEFDFKK